MIHLAMLFFAGYGVASFVKDILEAFQDARK